MRNKTTIIFLAVFLTAIPIYGVRSETRFIQSLFQLLLGIDPSQSDSYVSSQAHLKHLSSNVTMNSFMDFILQPSRKQRMCLPDDIYEAGQTGLRNKFGRRIVKVKCTRNLNITNGTEPEVHIISSLKEVATLLAPYRNGTRRNEVGHCALVMFFAKSCPSSAMFAPYYNAMARQYPDLKVAAIDAFKFHNLNREFGIVGVPTIMLFHEGRPVVKFNDTELTAVFEIYHAITKFVYTHTGLSAKMNGVYMNSGDFKGPLSNIVVVETDYCLYMAWTFILICGFYFFTKTVLCKRIVDMIKRTWQESEAQAQHQ